VVEIWDDLGEATGAGPVAIVGLPGGPPEPARGEPENGYLATLRADLTVAASRPRLRTALVTAAVVGGLDAVEALTPTPASRGP